MIRNRAFAPLAALALSAALAIPIACSDGTAPGGGNGNGSTSVLLTDAPFPYDSLQSVNVYVVSIAASVTGDTTAGAPWVTIAEPHRAFDMLDLQNGRTALAGAADIPAGEYKAVRMVIDTDSSSIITKDGLDASVDWQSSAGRPVLYALVERPVSVPEDGASIVIDFDVGRSFLCPIEGCSSFIFSPVLRAVDEAATGSVSGTVRANGGAAVPHATITIFTDSTQAPGPWFAMATGQTDDQGAYKIMYVPPGSYILRADPPAGSGLSAGFLFHVTVTAGEETAGQGITVWESSSAGGDSAAVGSVSVTPASASGDAGGVVQLYGIAYDSGGQPVPAAIHWSSSAPAVAAVDTAGTVHLLSEGTATITASAGAAVAQSTITVRPAGVPVASVTVDPATSTLAVNDSVQLHATLRDADGHVLSRGVTWSSSDSTVARVFFDGLVQAVKSGSATITASSEGVSGTGRVTVQ